MDNFRTAGKYGEDEFIERKSRFIGQCRPIKNQVTQVLSKDERKPFSKLCQIHQVETPAQANYRVNI